MARHNDARPTDKPALTDGKACSAVAATANYGFVSFSVDVAFPHPDGHVIDIGEIACVANSGDRKPRNRDGASVVLDARNRQIQILDEDRCDGARPPVF